MAVSEQQLLTVRRLSLSNQSQLWRQIGLQEPAEGLSGHTSKGSEMTGRFYKTDRVKRENRKQSRESKLLSSKRAK